MHCCQGSIARCAVRWFRRVWLIRRVGWGWGGTSAHVQNLARIARTVQQCCKCSVQDDLDGIREDAGGAQALDKGDYVAGPPLIQHNFHRHIIALHQLRFGAQAGQGGAGGTSAGVRATPEESPPQEAVRRSRGAERGAAGAGHGQQRAWRAPWLAPAHL